MQEFWLKQGDRVQQKYCHLHGFLIQSILSNPFGTKLMMKPILFSAPMVRAILGGRKTQTRRIIKPQPELCHGCQSCEFKRNHLQPIKPAFEKEDILWVRETWQINNDGYVYFADGEQMDKWKPSIFMPKEACRLFLKIQEVRIQGLQDISEEDAIAEGIDGDGEVWRDYTKPEILPSAWVLDPKHSFQSLWYEINGQESWDSNPWIWVIKFEVKNDEANTIFGQRP